MVIKKPDFEALAEGLRDGYWKALGEECGPWQTASAKSKAAWRTVARKMYDAMRADNDSLALAVDTDDAGSDSSRGSDSCA